MWEVVCVVWSGNEVGGICGRSVAGGSEVVKFGRQLSSSGKCASPSLCVLDLCVCFVW